MACAVHNEPDRREENHLPEKRARIASPEIRHPDGDGGDNRAASGIGTLSARDEEHAHEDQAEDADPDRERQDLLQLKSSLRANGAAVSQPSAGFAIVTYDR